MEHPNENEDIAVQDVLPTIVTNSPTSSSPEGVQVGVLSDQEHDTRRIVASSSNHATNDTFTSTWGVSSKSGSTSRVICSTRASGQVCICDICEAARLRLLHRYNRSDIKANNDTLKTTPLTTTTIAVSSNKRSREYKYDDADDLDHYGNQQLITIPCRAPSLANIEGKGSVPTDSINNNNNDTDKDQDPDEQKLQIMSNACRTILQCIGEDPDREGLQKTPERWAKALLYLCHGYHISPSQVTNNAIFYENHNEMVVVRNIDIHSLCEHHMVPFTGHVHIGYIPNGKIIGLSKLARLADLFARRLQVQERLTRQIADSIVETITPLGVAVVMECTHYCMVMRGVQKTGATTTTSSVRGCFETNSKTRAEFFSILHGGK
jgi:GTP cyclohydrolase IA